MRGRRIRFLSIVGLPLAVLCTASVLFVSSAHKDSRERKSPRRTDVPVTIKIVPWGPTQADVDRVIRELDQNRQVIALLKGTDHRRLTFELMGPDTPAGTPTVAPNGFRAIYFDYTNNRSVIAQGSFDHSYPTTVTPSDYQPISVDNDEFNAAVDLLKGDLEFGSKLAADQLKVYQPMPPIVFPKAPGQKIDRIVNVGLSGSGDGVGADNQIVGVNLGRKTVVHFANNAPPQARATEAGCGVSTVGGSISRGTPGQFQVTITQGQTTLWDMLVIRPSASSGLNGSGIEFHDVKYLGKLVLKRMNMPVLDVEYTGTCGPFRDWLYSETWFQIDPSSPAADAPGIRRSSPGVATTIVESHSDAGNYQGVAYYTQNNETVFVSELSAGWYRYINEYRFGNDGTIRPRIGYGSTVNSCVCIQRNHHAYWRFDFDVDGTNNEMYEMRGAKPLYQLTNEFTAYRKQNLFPQSRQSWMIRNPATGMGYVIEPGPTDGTAAVAPFGGSGVDTFGQSDVWGLVYKPGSPDPGELDDAGGLGSGINLAPYFATPEALQNQDLVFWYGIHVQRQDDESRSGLNILSGEYVVGPTLHPYGKW
jgi:hypothetical protein